MNKNEEKSVRPMVRPQTMKEEDSRYGYQGGPLGVMNTCIAIAIILWAGKLVVDAIMILPLVVN